MKYTKKAGQVVGMLAGVMVTLSGASAAHAAETSVDIGPVAVPNTVVQACHNDACITTPSLKEISVDISLDAINHELVVPTVTSEACPGNSTGVVLHLSSPIPVGGALAVTISGTQSDDSPYLFNYAPGPIVLGAGPQTLSFCAQF